MEREERYRAEVQRLKSRAELLDFWRRLMQPGGMEGWEPGRALEYLVLRAFELEGAQVVWPYVSQWEQVDGGLYVDGLSVLLECKDWSRPVDVSALARLKLRLDLRPPGVVGLLFSSEDFSDAAEEHARRNPQRNVLLWRGREMPLALQGGMCTALQAKWRRAVEHGDLNYILDKRDFP